MGFDISDVGHPDAVEHIDFELPIQDIVGDYRWLATISTRAAFVANLCCDAS